MKKKLVVVLGMHRSGTSAITRGLGTLGVALEGNYHPGIKGDNEKGFFEDLDIVALNQEVLNFLGYDWDIIGRIPENSFLNPFLKPLQDKARGLLSGKMQSENILGVKDPRLSRLLPFWKPIFEELDLDVCYLISLRNPLSVSKSLQQRDGLLAVKSYKLWLCYVTAAVLDSNKPCIVVNFDNLVEHPFSQLFRIAKVLDLPLPDLDSEAFRQYQNDFLDTSLRHTKYSCDVLASTPEVPSYVKQAFYKLEQLSQSEIETIDPLTLEWFSKLSDSLLDVDNYASNCILLAERDAALTERDAALAERDAALTYIQFLTNTKSWRITKPMRFAVRLVRQGLNDENRQHLTQALLHRYQRLPLPSAAKSVMRFAYHRVFRKIVRLVRTRMFRVSQFHLPSIKPILKLHNKL